MSDEILADIKRRHSPLHTVDKECTAAAKAMLRMQKVCLDEGLDAEIKAAFDALVALHTRAKQKWEAIR